MARLIDADKLLNLYDMGEEFERYASALSVPIPVIRQNINDMPTVDAGEVVHGRWEDEYGGKYANPRYRCSICKEKALYKFERDLLDNWKEVQALTPNCPYCMAKLDGGKEA